MKYLEHFQKVGQWKIVDSKKSNKSLEVLNLPGIKAEIFEEFQKSIELIYLFKIGNEILYIGETSSQLKERLYSYEYGFDKINDTDNRVKLALTKRLCENQKIDILIWQPRTLFYLGEEEITISLSKPLEEILIKKLSLTSELVNAKGNSKSYYTNEKDINRLFEIEPELWGLRGDPYLWSELKRSLLLINKLLTSDNFDFCLNRIFEYIILSKGEPIDNDQVHFISFPQDGMSGGSISRNWWTTTGIPILKSRYKNEC